MRILYVDIDTLRPDHLGCYGYGRNTSPNIDRVAEEGVRFTDYYCADAPCLPSRAGLVTGRFGIHTGCINHGGINAEMRWEGPDRAMQDGFSRFSLPAMMRRAGLHTASVSSFADRHGAWWFNGGFDECFNVGKRGLEPADDVLPIALKWLRDNRDRENWFLHVHLWDPHIPYRTPESFGEPFADVPLPDNWMTEELLQHQRQHCVGAHSAREVNGYANTPDEEHPRQPVQVDDLAGFRKLIDEYDTGVLYADRAVGMILEELRAQGVYEEMAVIVSSDHGESLGELGSYCEHGEADGIVTHIPMIIKWPGCPKNAVSRGFHYQLDLLPTLVDLLGGVQPVQSHRVAGKVIPWDYDGESYAEQVRTGEDGGREYLVVSQCAHVCQRAVRFGDYIYIRTYHDGFHLSEPEELFNLKEDPHEQHNLAEELPEVCWHGAWYLERWVAEQMQKNIDNYATDPLWEVIHEGGPFHCRGYLPTYCERLEQTGRAAEAAALRERHPREMKESW